MSSNAVSSLSIMRIWYDGYLSPNLIFMFVFSEEYPLPSQLIIPGWEAERWLIVLESSGWRWHHSVVSAKVTTQLLRHFTRVSPTTTDIINTTSCCKTQFLSPHCSSYSRLALIILFVLILPPLLNSLLRCFTWIMKATVDGHLPASGEELICGYCYVIMVVVVYGGVVWCLISVMGMIYT